MFHRILVHGVQISPFHLRPSAVDRAKAPLEVAPSNLGRGSLPVPGLEGSCSVHCQPLRSAPEAGALPREQLLWRTCALGSSPWPHAELLCYVPGGSPLGAAAPAQRAQQHLRSMPAARPPGAALPGRGQALPPPVLQVGRGQAC